MDATAPLWQAMRPNRMISVEMDAAARKETAWPLLTHVPAPSCTERKRRRWQPFGGCCVLYTEACDVGGVRRRKGRPEGARMGHTVPVRSPVPERPGRKRRASCTAATVLLHVAMLVLCLILSGGTTQAQSFTVTIPSPMGEMVDEDAALTLSAGYFSIAESGVADTDELCVLLRGNIGSITGNVACADAECDDGCRYDVYD